MKEYEEYLRKLQSKMDFSDKVDYKAVEQYLERRDEYRVTFNLLALCVMLLIPVLWYLGVSSYGDNVYANFLSIGVMLVMLILGCTSIVNGSKADHYSSMASTELDKIYTSNYKTIKNEIVSDGDEQIRQLILWENMYELSPTYEIRYRELLRIVKSVCREYSEIYK